MFPFVLVKRTKRNELKNEFPNKSDFPTYLPNYFKSGWQGGG